MLKTEISAENEGFWNSLSDHQMAQKQEVSSDSKDGQTVVWPI